MSERRREHSVATASPPGTAGVMISLSRILTKLLLPDERASTIIFFLVSAGLELLCFLLHLLVRRSRFVLYYTTRPRDSRPIRAGYRVHHDVASGDIHFVSAVAWHGLLLPHRRLKSSSVTSFMAPCSRAAGWLLYSGTFIPFCGPFSLHGTTGCLWPSPSCGVPRLRPEALFSFCGPPAGTPC